MKMAWTALFAWTYQPGLLAIVYYFFSHNKTTSAGLLAAETISRTYFLFATFCSW
jgi:hypothetical protein